MDGPLLCSVYSGFVELSYCCEGKSQKLCKLGLVMLFEPTRWPCRHWHHIKPDSGMAYAKQWQACLPVC